jgi:hypothetical protein
MTPIDDDKIIEVMAEATAQVKCNGAIDDECKGNPNCPCRMEAIDVLTALSSSGYLICQASDAVKGEAVSRKSALQSDDCAEALRAATAERDGQWRKCIIAYGEYLRHMRDVGELDAAVDIAPATCPCPPSEEDFAWAEREIARLNQEPEFLAAHTQRQLEEAQADTATAKAARLTTVAKACVEAIEDGDPDGAYTMLKHALCQLEEATQEPMSGPLSNETAEAPSYDPDRAFRFDISVDEMNLLRWSMAMISYQDWHPSDTRADADAMNEKLEAMAKAFCNKDRRPTEEPQGDDPTTEQTPLA